MHDGAPTYVVQSLLKSHFTNNRVIARHFTVRCPPQSPIHVTFDFGESSKIEFIGITSQACRSLKML